jgi:hypothetical protein
VNYNGTISSVNCNRQSILAIVMNNKMPRAQEFGLCLPLKIHVAKPTIEPVTRIPSLMNSQIKKVVKLKKSLVTYPTSGVVCYWNYRYFFRTEGGVIVTTAACGFPQAIPKGFF